MFLVCGLESNAIQNRVDSGLDNLQHPLLHRDFAAKLLEIIVDPYRATLTRQSAACYLASFVSRASYVGPETVCESISALLRWAEAYICALKVERIRAADARDQSELHSLFYTVCQAAFYIMCFRGMQAIDYYRSAVEYHARTPPPEDDELDTDMPHPDHIDLGDKRWTTICTNDLQPLRFCLESVRSEFLHVAHAFDLIEEQTLDRLVAEAKRLSTGHVSKKSVSRISTVATLEKKRQAGGVGGLGRGSNPLNSFFPFDPFLLRRSHDFIEPFYNYWQGSIEERDMVENDEDDQIFDPSLVTADETDESHHEAEDDDSVSVSSSVGDSIPLDPMSFASANSRPSLSTPDSYKQAQRLAWTDTMKRPRSQSVENGSW